MRSPAKVVVAFCAALQAAYLVWHVAGWGSEAARVVVADAIFIPLAVGFLGFGILAARKPGLSPRTRLAWRFIAVALFCEAMAHWSWFVEDVILHETAYPTVADYWFLAFVPFMFAGLLLLPAAGRSRREKIKLALDALIVGASAFMVLWFLVLGPVLETAGANLSEVVYSAALPIGDLLLVLALTLVLLGRGGSTDRSTVHLLSGAVALFVVADTYYGYIQLHAGFIGGSWPDALWSTGCLLLVLAAYRQYRLGGEETPAGAGRAGSAINWLPYGAIGLAYTLLGIRAREEGLYPLGGMIIGAALLTSLVVVRQMYALRENRDLAVTDPLTGLANRTLMTERLRQLTAHPLRDGQYSAVLVIDLDRFKPINDRYGHEAGDAVLNAVATALRAAIRSRDTAGRLGGDEFAVILHNLPTRDAAAGIAARLIESLRTPVIFGHHLLTVEASIGVAVRDDATATGDLLLHQADTAMYAAKRTGRDRHVVYSPELDIRSRDLELREAITAGELVVHYQPIVELAGGRVVAVEALVRWDRPGTGLLMPGDFIELAEETGAVVPLGEWVLEAACRQVGQWPDLDLSVNLSPKQVLQPDLVEVVRSILDSTGFPPQRLILELTESGILQPDQATVARLESLREMGIRIAVDDFGTGFSALSYLRELPVTTLKIDRSFVTGVASDPDARVVAEALVRLGAAFRLTVTAEGIETREQADALREMECEHGQGYYFHRPLDGAALARVLAQPVRS